MRPCSKAIVSCSRYPAGDDEKPQGDGQKEPSKPDAEHPDTGDTTSTGAAGMLTLLAGGAAVVLRRRRKQGKSEN